MEITVNWVFSIISTGAIGLISWSLKQLYSQSKAEKDETRRLILQQDIKSKEESEKLGNKIYRLEEKLPEKYVLKEDFYREINKLDLKLDSIKDDVSELNKNVAAVLAMMKEG